MQKLSSIKWYLKFSLLITFLMSISPVSKVFAGPSPFDTVASHAILLDADTGEVLFEKNADDKMHPSSMTKILTAYTVFQKLKEGKLTMEQELPVSVTAYRMEGSRMFLEPNTVVKVSDLLKGIIIQSGNDACVVFGEALAGNDRAFGEELTRIAHALGATHTHFINSTGLPDELHQTTPRDLAIISLRLIHDFPEYYPLFSQVEFTYNNIKQGNRNPLLYKNIGADGIKTGSTEIAGFGIVASAKQMGRRLLLVLNGLSSMNERSREAENLLGWGFREFDNVLIAQAGQVIEEVPVANGVIEKVGLQVPQNILMTLPRDNKPQVKAVIKYQRPLVAPITAEQVVGHLIVSVPHRADRIINLYASHSVERSGFFRRIFSSLKRLIFGDSMSPSEKAVVVSQPSEAAPSAPLVSPVTTAPTLSQPATPAPEKTVAHP